VLVLQAEHAEESTAAKVPLYFVRYAEYGSSIYSEAFVVVREAGPVPGLTASNASGWSRFLRG